MASTSSDANALESRSGASSIILTSPADSFWRWRGTARGGFAGVDNFTSLFTTFPLNQQLWPAFWHTMVFFVGTMVVQNTFGLLVAVLLFELPVARRFLRTVYTVPYLIGGLVVGYLWSLLLSPTFGPFNAGLRLPADQAARLLAWSPSTQVATSVASIRYVITGVRRVGLSSPIGITGGLGAFERAGARWVEGERRRAAQCTTHARSGLARPRRTSGSILGSLSPL